MPDAPRVFVSYSHDSDSHRSLVLRLADRLRQDGIDAWIDQYETSAIDDWPRWMRRQIDRAAFVLLVYTETYRRRFEGEETEGGKGADWEGRILTEETYDRSRKPVLPVLFDPADERHRPAGFRGGDFFVLRPDRGFTLDDRDGYEPLYRLLTGQPAVAAGPVGELRRLPALSRPELAAHPSEITGDHPLASYRAWAEAHHGRLHMIGLDAGDVRVSLDEIYVPLKVADRGRLGDELHGLMGGGRSGSQDTFDVSEALRVGGGRHLVIFGEPGSGKTTALQKLHQSCWEDPVGLGLEPDTVPVFLRLRRLDRELLDENGLQAAVDREIEEISGRMTLRGIAAELWTHGRLLLLFDGLDEIADEKSRARVLRRIAWHSKHMEHARVVVSCRRVALPKAEADRDRFFETFEVRPLQNPQIRRLVDLWFREMARLGKITDAEADDRVAMLHRALAGSEYSTRNLLELVSNPLLLTLLCVVVLLGGDMPKERIRFYERCLDVLLERWPRRKGRPGPTDLHTSLRALARLACFLHAAGRRDDLARPTAVRVLKEVLGDRNTARDFFGWAVEHAGVLSASSDCHFGFVHLGFQEYLTGLHLEEDPERLSMIEGEIDRKWWREVFRQLSYASEHRAFVVLTRRLLFHTDVWHRGADLLRDCLDETRNPDLAAFEEALHDGDADRSKAVLRLLSPLRNKVSGSLLETIRETAERGPEPVRAQASRWLEGREQSSALTDRVGLVYDSDESAHRARELAQKLRRHQGGCPVSTAKAAFEEAEDMLSDCGIGVILAGPEDDWEIYTDLAELFEELPWLVVRLPGETRVTVPEKATAPEAATRWEVQDWHLGRERELVEQILERSERTPTSKETGGYLSLGAAEEASAEDRHFDEPITGERFLFVPPGEFRMGAEQIFTREELERFGWDEDVLDRHRPEHRVRLSEYWLAQAPVTNRQYALFMADAGDDFEPSEWRNGRFNGPDQPVVGVTWHQAVAYCDWLSSQAPGRRFSLPTEAQWEYAARGPKSRLYPWGNEPEPNEELACFDRDYTSGGPAPVAGYPGGAGPFGHLDLAGNVWEWCLDAWDPSYESREDGCLDPIGKGDPDLRPLRGGCWYLTASGLRSAIRLRDWPGDRVGNIGFRVSCAPDPVPRLGSPADPSPAIAVEGSLGSGDAPNSRKPNLSEIFRAVPGGDKTKSCLGIYSVAQRGKTRNQEPERAQETRKPTRTTGRLGVESCSGQPPGSVQPFSSRSFQPSGLHHFGSS